MRTLVLNGFMATGKTTIGRILADRAKVPFVDLDAEIEAAAGRSVAEIFAERGEAAFRSLETTALHRALATSPSVIAVGGGALLDATMRREVLRRACVVTLTAAEHTIARRTQDATRPLLVSPDRIARIRELLSARSTAYAETHGVINTEGRTTEAIADAVVAYWRDPIVCVPLGTRSYTVRITHDAAEVVADKLVEMVPSSVHLVTDTTVRALAAHPFEVALRTRAVPAVTITAVEPGEQNKRLGTIEQILTNIVGSGADRDAVVLGLGGGVVTDMAGFAAATALRGIRWIAAPTTLLAMVDASVGGKTGVDIGEAKNAAGAFHQPHAVVIQPRFVQTETPRAYKSGLAEVVKTGAIGDVALLEVLEKERDPATARDATTVGELVFRSVAVKASIVSRDEHEGGDRAFLNFGHTVGHALEAEGGFDRLTHGEAVALGTVAALRVGVRLGITPPSVEQRITALLQRIGLEIDLDAQPLALALSRVGFDKKRRGGAVRMVFLKELGEPVLHALDPSTLPRLLKKD